jgi:hypothetical protein
LVTPDFLRKPAVQEWLAGERVKSDFKALARARVLGGDSVVILMMTRKRSYGLGAHTPRRLANSIS